MRVGFAGLGTVAVPAVRQLQRDPDFYTEAAGEPLQVVAASARDRAKDRGLDLRGVKWYDDAVRMARARNVDVVVELIGGADGVALRVVRAAIAAGKHVVTANKALMAKHGMELARAAEWRGVTIAFEAAVAGAVPIIGTLRQTFRATRIRQIVGILNGTTNFILWRMSTTGCTYEQALAEAQQNGFAEQDPTLDVDGHDAAQKLAILCTLAFRRWTNLDQISVEGIRGITAFDIEQAQNLETGFTVKLLAIARKTEAGLIHRVGPCLVPADCAIAKIDGPSNAIIVDGELSGPILLQGQGAGGNPTAFAVLSDIVDLVSGRRVPPFVVDAQRLQEVEDHGVARESGTGEYYVRVVGRHEAGVLAQVTNAFAVHGVSVDSFGQPKASVNGFKPMGFTTDKNTPEAAVRSALRMIRELPAIQGELLLMRIEREV